MATPPDLADQRAPTRLTIQPGFFTESSARGSQRWKTGDKVRFKNGLPEKLGGWIEQELTGDTHTGVARRAHEWTSLDGESWIAYGTNTKLYLVNRNVRYDITPIRRSIALTNPFTTAMASANVVVTDAGHGVTTGDAVRFAGGSAVAGITISGEYVVVSVLGDTYTITHSAPANASTTGGGSVQADYDLDAGAASKTLALGYGVCKYGESTYGTARSISCSGIVRDLRIWSLDNFGEDLIASPRGGAVYHWDRTTGPLSRAVQLTSAPQTNQRVLVSKSGVQVVCLGAFDPVANSPDPMFIRVGAVGSLTEFTLDEEGQNSVFEERLAVGSKIVGGERTRAGILVSTDEADYLMQDDPQDIFRIVQLAAGNAFIAPNAGVEVDGVAYYMAPYKFMRFDGVLDEIPCEVWQRVFAENIGSVANPDRISREQVDKVYCWYNEKFSEIWWFYPSADGTGENDRYVIFNTQERCWYFGTIERTAAVSVGPAYDLPTAFDATGTFFLHESGVDDDDAPMSAAIESYDTMLGEGKVKVQMTKAIPDMVRFAGTVLLYLKAKRYPRDAAYVTKGPYTITTSTRAKGVNITGRQVAIRMESTALGDDWRMDAWTFYGQPDAEDS